MFVDIGTVGHQCRDSFSTYQLVHFEMNFRFLSTLLTLFDKKTALQSVLALQE